MMPVFTSKQIKHYDDSFLKHLIWCLIALLSILNASLWYMNNVSVFTRLNRLSYAENMAPRALPEVFVMTKSQIAGFIVTQAVIENLDPIRMLAIADCESKLNPKATNPKSSSKGLYQILSGTQKEVEKATNKKYDAFDVEDNVEMAFWQIKKYGNKPFKASERCWRGKVSS